MDLVVILTVVIPAFLVAMGFYFFVVCVIGGKDGQPREGKDYKPRDTKVAATYWGRYQTPNTCIRAPRETISLPRITPKCEPSIHIDPNWN